MDKSSLFQGRLPRILAELIVSLLQLPYIHLEVMRTGKFPALFKRMRFTKDLVVDANRPGLLFDSESAALDHRLFVFAYRVANIVPLLYLCHRKRITLLKKTYDEHLSPS